MVMRQDTLSAPERLSGGVCLKSLGLKPENDTLTRLDDSCRKPMSSTISAAEFFHQLRDECEQDELNLLEIKYDGDTE